MDQIKEGIIRQTTDNPYPELKLLGDRGTVLGQKVIRRGDSIFIKTNFEDIPIYAFKMNGQLMDFLREHRSVWDGE